MAKLFYRLKNKKAGPGECYVPTKVEHYANLATHCWMIPIGLVTMFSLINKASNFMEMFCGIVYGVAIIMLFSVSSCFHFVSLLGKHGVHFTAMRPVKQCLHIGDRAVIYIFIASSYTPWLVLKKFDGLWGQYTLGIVWVCAIIGIVYQYTFHERYKCFETVLYLAVGILPALIVFQMKEKSGLYEVAVGGLVYVLGVIFFKLDGVVPFAHAIWHCFVLVGVWVHYLAVDRYLYTRNSFKSTIINVE